ncbi:TetR/AcrR family transcriptional regulator [Burkholderia cepacia]|uniref:TetR/AcrR family transcriptional regulator n=1 Tax=Burkholderia cepacia TaxID=292 RepID=UPI002AB6E435|nr:hypothetical protein [Burkholderia cepacia]
MWKKTMKSVEGVGSGGELSVRERVEAALAFLASEDNGGRLSVSAVCRLAGVSRANLYSSHPDIVDRIVRRRLSQQSSKAVASKDGAEALNEMKRCLAEWETKYRSLLVVCVEQQAEISFLRRKLNECSDRNAPNIAKPRRGRRP